MTFLRTVFISVELMPFAGGYDASYLDTYAGLDRDQLLGKLALLRGPVDPVDDIQDLAIPVVSVQGLFELHKLPSIESTRPGPISLPAPGRGNIITNGGLISPQSESRFSRTSDTVRPGVTGKLIDPTKVRRHYTP